MKIIGNTFDYPSVHGKAIQAVGNYSFVSCSDEAVEKGILSLEDYPIADYILGLEKEGNSSNPARNTYYNILLTRAAHIGFILPVGRQSSG